MRYSGSSGATVTASLIVIVILLVISAVIGGFLWPYTLNAWLVYAGKAAVVKFWHGALLGFCPWIGQLSIPLAVITWIAMLFLV